MSKNATIEEAKGGYIIRTFKPSEKKDDAGELMYGGKNEEHVAKTLDEAVAVVRSFME